jgi:outer membrane immunogenic protein
MRREFFLVTGGAIAIARSAFAAEPTPPPLPPPVFTWSGVYIGGQIGYAWGTDNASWTGTANNLDLAAGSFGLGPQGVIGGAHVGYNLQPVTPFWSWLVFGIEASVDGTSLGKTVNFPLADFARVTFGSLTASSNEPVQGSVRGRIGIAWDRFLLFGEGGVAVTSFNTTYIDTTGFFTGIPGTNTTISNTRAGFTVGGGLEYAVTDNWSVQAEYRHSKFGRVSDFPYANPNIFVLPPGGFFVVQHWPTEDQVQVGVSYRFDMMVPPPPSAAPPPGGPAVPPGGPAVPPGPPGSPYALSAAPPAQPVAAR